MKYLFAVILLILIGFSMLVGLSMPDSRSDVPVIYWVTDANPARIDQVMLFHQWMVEQGHYEEFTLNNADEVERFVARNTILKDVLDEKFQPRSADLKLIYEAVTQRQSPPPVAYPLVVRLPKAKLVLDMGNRDITKQVVQGVSGVAGDIQDVTGSDMWYFRAIGLNHDVTEWGLELGFDPSKTYPAIVPDLTIPDENGNLRQYQFPCNVNASAYFVNREAFRQYGQELPPRQWTIEEFERRGKEFVRKANEGRTRQTVFFADTLPVDVLRASLGGSRFNETGTRATLDEPAHIEALRLMRKWTFEDRLFPTDSDRSGFSVESGYGGLTAQLFNNNFQPERGQVAMMWTGRYLLIEFRKYDAERLRRGQPLLDYGVSEPPHGGFRNTQIGTRAAMIYEGSPHKDLAKYFLAFLASETYNMQIVKDGDALPPNPVYTRSEEYARPREYPNEWDVHTAYAEIAETIAISSSYSPFILTRTASRIEYDAHNKYMQSTPLAGYETAERTAHAANAEMNAEMQRTLKENPDLQPRYDALWKRQQQIDELKRKISEFEAAHPGQSVPEEIRIPLNWIENPFYRAYYKHKGWVK